ncbi:hypothetical protein ADEAN_000901000 [Angomonas deanei]|uniref:Uncharacterized protein n=1 Tax=Angomonas deanei TaxID=59799 RepID=A0A7G2CNP7_9TRYP|nr:hypothetical protein ADEAN_000901000 [Angomonas deanei]
MEEKKRCFSWDGSSSPQNNNNQNSSPKSPVKLEWNSPTRTPSPVLKSTDMGLVENATPHRKSSSFHYLESETILASTCPSKLMTLVGTANENMKEDEKEDGKCSSSEASLSNRTLPPPKENPKTNQNDSCTRRRHTTEEEASLPQQKKKSVNVHPNRSNSFTNGFDLEKYNSRPITDENKNNQHRHQSERRPTPEDYEKLQRSVQDTEQRSLRILKRIKLLKTEEEALRGHLHRLSLKQQKLLSVLPAVRRTTSQHYIHGASSRFAGDSSIFRHSHTTHNNNNNHNVDSHTNSNGDTVTVNVPNSNPNTNPNTHHQHYYFTETDPNNNSENDADGRTNSNGDSYKIVDPSIYAHYAYQSLRLDNNNHNNIEGHFPPPTKPQAPLTFYDLLQPFYSSDNNNSNEISKNEISDENEECSNHHHNHDKSHHSPPRKEGAVRLYTSHGGRKEDVMTELNFRQSERTE